MQSSQYKEACQYETIRTQVLFTHFDHIQFVDSPNTDWYQSHIEWICQKRLQRATKPANIGTNVAAVQLKKM